VISAFVGTSEEAVVGAEETGSTTPTIERLICGRASMPAAGIGVLKLMVRSPTVVKERIRDHRHGDRSRLASTW